MSGNKTHEQQRRILEKRVDTSNADKDFDPRPILKAAEEGPKRGPGENADTARPADAAGGPKAASARREDDRE